MPRSVRLNLRKPECQVGLPHCKFTFLEDKRSNEHNMVLDVLRCISLSHDYVYGDLGMSQTWGRRRVWGQSKREKGVVNSWPKIPLEAGPAPPSESEFESGRIPNPSEFSSPARAGLEVAGANLGRIDRFRGFATKFRFDSGSTLVHLVEPVIGPTKPYGHPVNHPRLVTLVNAGQRSMGVTQLMQEEESDDESIDFE
ncbi:hypothetical protein PIB30_072283 [Stylosanthes scabra]|uniref:Uncharacterized protein n=1 Tax=Stylosanthes scabra TaxID=79078 RepID=A0ABU6ZMU0_9FABA|nr:hypothetical protein [Stylosanthes scabra]